MQNEIDLQNPTSNAVVWDGVSVLIDDQYQVTIDSQDEEKTCLVSTYEQSASNQITYSFQSAHITITPLLIRCSYTNDEEILDNFTLSGTISNLTGQGLRLQAVESGTNY